MSVQLRQAVRITPILLLLLSCATQPAAVKNPSTAPPASPYPVSQATPVVETMHGVTITDPYRWLEDQEAPATRDWINRQNAYTDSVLGPRPEKQTFVPRLTALLDTEQITVPILKNNRYFFTKRARGEDVFSIYMREGANGQDIRLIDPAPWSPDHTTNVVIWDITEDGKLLAYGVRKGGADEVEIHVFDVDARHDLDMTVPLARYHGFDIAPDGKTLYYSRVVAGAGPRVFRRGVNKTDQEEMLFGEGYAPDMIIQSGLSEDGRWLLIHVLYGAAARKTEIYAKDLRANGPLITVAKDVDARSFADFAGNDLVIQTNWNAPNERMMAVSLNGDPSPSHWREIVPENKNAAIQGTALAGGKVFVRYLENVRPRIVSYDLQGQKGDEIAFEQLGRLEDISGSWESPVAFFRFGSFHVPPTIYAYDVASRSRSTFAQTSAPVNPSDYTVEQIFYPSKDGTKIPMFIFYKKGLQKNGANPTYLTGYGGFTSSQLPAFSARALAWVDAGGVYALANLRGGSEYGETWHQAGMLAKKQNVFDDFIAAGEALIREHYTSPRHLGIAGTSNGGLLVMAIGTQRPDLVKAVYCGYPLIDMLRYHKFLVGGFWVPEYGNAERAEDFQWIYPYSPYQHVKKGEKYPAVLFVTGDADTRVAPLHARKMTAMLQNNTGSDNPILLRYHVSGGHSGGEPLHVQVENEAESLGFLWWTLSREAGEDRRASRAR